MSLLCRCGIHAWKPVERLLNEPKRKELQILVVPSLFAGPPRMVGTGIYYDVTRVTVGHKCHRCGVRR